MIIGQIWIGEISLYIILNSKINPFLSELDIDKVLQHFQDYKHNKLNQSDLKSKVQSILKSNNDLIQYFTWKKGQEGRAQQVGNFDPDLEREFNSMPNNQFDELLDMNFI